MQASSPRRTLPPPSRSMVSAPRAIRSSALKGDLTSPPARPNQERPWRGRRVAQAPTVNRFDRTGPPGGSIPNGCGPRVQSSPVTSRPTAAKRRDAHDPTARAIICRVGGASVDRQSKPPLGTRAGRRRIGRQLRPRPVWRRHSRARQPAWSATHMNTARFQLLMDGATKRALRHLAVDLGIPAVELVRRALRQYLDLPRRPKRGAGRPARARR